MLIEGCKMKENNKLAPIVLFTYNRPLHTRQTIEALQRNEYASESELYIYSDGPKNNDVREGVDKTREYIETVRGFKKITIIQRDKNWGLADSIIDGVTNVVNQYGKIIVLEDDIVTSPYFLKFMNDALEFYENEKKVWHISGWNYPIDIDDTSETFLWRVMCCWGWATWKDRWQFFNKDTNSLIDAMSRYDIYKFNLDGTSDFWSQVIANENKNINTWAIYWYATIFQQKGLCLNPTQTYVDNIGCDSSGTHCKVRSYQDNVKYSDKVVYTKYIQENQYYVEKVKKLLLPPLIKMNSRLVFNQQLSNIQNYLVNLRKTNEIYCVYGAGSGCDLILNFLQEQVVAIFDKNSTLNQTLKCDIAVSSNQEVLKMDSVKIIISVFGREEEIKKFLIDEVDIDLNRILMVEF
jgi:hypothetical protein